MRRDVKALLLGAFRHFCPAFCGYKSLPCPLCPPTDFLILVSVLVKAPAPPDSAEPGLFLDGKPCCRDSSLNQNDCQVPLSDSGNLLFPTQATCSVTPPLHQMVGKYMNKTNDNKKKLFWKLRRKCLSTIIIFSHSHSPQQPKG